MDGLKEIAMALVEKEGEMNQADAVSALDAYEEEVAYVLSDISGKEIGSLSELLSDRPWRSVEESVGASSSQSFMSGFVFGIFAAKSILIAASRAIAEPLSERDK